MKKYLKFKLLKIIVHQALKGTILTVKIGQT